MSEKFNGTIIDVDRRRRVVCVVTMTMDKEGKCCARIVATYIDATGIEKENEIYVIFSHGVAIGIARYIDIVTETW